MILLAIDTSGPNCAVCLARRAQGGGVTFLAERQERIGRGHAERLVPMVEEALADTRLGFEDLERIAVAIGPGSFTGVRVGVAAARGLALALGIEAVGVGSLEALAAEAAAATGAALVVAALVGPRGDVFAYADAAAAPPGHRQDSGQGIHLAPALVGPDVLARTVAGWRRQPVALIGSAARPLTESLLRQGVDTRLVREADAPEVAWIARLALAGAGQSPPRPLYLRPPDAQPQTGRAVARV
jgi:tRNA threonylcarbamoyladenosine biosynthesis protein TsaB